MNSGSALTIFGIGAFMLISCSETTRNSGMKPSIHQDSSYSKPGNNYYRELPDQSPDNSDERSYALSSQWSKIQK